MDEPRVPRIENEHRPEPRPEPQPREEREPEPEQEPERELVPEPEVRRESEREYPFRPVPSMGPGRREPIPEHDVRVDAPVRDLDHIDYFYCHDMEYRVVYSHYYCKSCANRCTGALRPHGVRRHFALSQAVPSPLLCSRCNHPLQFIRRAKTCPGCRVYYTNSPPETPWGNAIVDIPMWAEELAEELGEPLLFEDKVKTE